MIGATRANSTAATPRRHAARAAAARRHAAGAPRHAERQAQHGGAAPETAALGV